MTNNHLYVSIDIEADGPIPGPNSMLSLGAAAFNPSLQGSARFQPISTFEINLSALLESKPDPDTSAWWKDHPEAYAAATSYPQAPEVAIPKFTAWLRALPGKPTCVAYPAGFDFTFVHVYNTRFDPNREDPFGFSCLDIKTLAAAALKVPYHQAIKRNMPKSWFKNPDGKAPRHTHKALDDALGQGILLLNILDVLGLG